MDPYRSSAQEPAAPRRVRLRIARELVGPFAIAWLLSFARVAWVVARGIELGAGDTMCAVAILALPLLLVEPRA